MMTQMYRPLRDAGAGGSGGGGGIDGGSPFNVATMAPEDIRGEPSLAAIKTVQDLAKGYVSAQKLIGAKRIAIPGENAQPAEWEAFYNQIGRPETSDKYEMPDAKTLKIDESLKIDEAKFKGFQKKMHELGLTSKQARGIMETYMTSMNEGVVGARGAQEKVANEAITTLKGEWGDNFQANVDVANSVLKKFGDESLLKYLEGTGMGNNVQLVKLLHKVGSAVLEDKDRGGSGGGLDLNDQTRAIHEINQLKTDADFQKALNDARHAGHRGAVDRWTKLFAVAYPGKQEE
jgi:hypothetical protein